MSDAPSHRRRLPATAIAWLRRVVAPCWPALAPWVALAPAVGAAHLLLDAVGVEPAAQTLVAAGVGLGMVVLPALRAAGPAPGHVGLVGHLVGLGAAVAAPDAGWVKVAVVAALTAGWAVSAAGTERPGRAAVTDLLARRLRGAGAPGGRAERVVRALPAWLAVVTFADLFGFVLDATGILADLDGHWVAAAFAGLGAGYAGLARLGRGWARPAGALSVTALALGGGGAYFAAPDGDAGLAAAAAALLGALAVRPLVRRPAVGWWAWLDSGVIAVQAARVAGLTSTASSAGAAAALTGNPPWYGVPGGVTLLVAVGLVRRHRRRSGRVGELTRSE